jgi:hypothetical protein
MESNRHQYAQGLRLLQIPIKSFKTSWNKQNMVNTSNKLKTTHRYHRRLTKIHENVLSGHTNLINNMHKNGTEPRRHERKKIIPTIPTYGYVAKQQHKNQKSTPMTTKSKENKMEPDWMTQKISSAEYVRRNYPRVEGDTPQLLTQPLFRKFNADSVNDYRQIIIDTDYECQQEVWT